MSIRIFPHNHKKFMIFTNPYYKNLKTFTLSEIIRSNIEHNQVNFKYKRTHISYYHFKQFLRSKFYKVTNQIKNKNSFFLSIFRLQRENSILNNILYDPKYSSKFIKRFFFFLVVMYTVYKSYYDKEKLIKKTDDIIKSLIKTKVCQNKTIINKLSWEILILCKQEKTHRLMRNLLLNEILKNPEIKRDLYILIKREIIAYIKSEHCLKELGNLIAKDVMKSPEIRNELYSLIRRFITLREVDFLEDKLEKIFVDVLNIQAIHNHVARKMEAEVNKAFGDDSIINLAVSTLIDKLK